MAFDTEGPGAGAGARGYVDGGKRVQQAMERVGKEVQRKLEMLIRNAAVETKRVAEQLVPVDTGGLRTRIKITKRGPTYYIVWVDPTQWRDGAIQANVVEFGRDNHPIPLPPQSFIRPAQAQVAEQFKRKARKIINDATKREFPARPA